MLTTTLKMHGKHNPDNAVTHYNINKLFASKYLMLFFLFFSLYTTNWCGTGKPGYVYYSTVGDNCCGLKFLSTKNRWGIGLHIAVTTTCKQGHYSTALIQPGLDLFDPAAEFQDGGHKVYCLGKNFYLFLHEMLPIYFNCNLSKGNAKFYDQNGSNKSPKTPHPFLQSHILQLCSQQIKYYGFDYALTFLFVDITLSTQNLDYDIGPLVDGNAKTCITFTMDTGTEGLI